MDRDYELAVLVFKALGDANRLTILEMLKNGEKCSNSLLGEMNITQPTLSHHIRVLSECGIIRGRRDGKNIFYSIKEDSYERVAKYVKLALGGKAAE